MPLAFWPSLRWGSMTCPAVAHHCPAPWSEPLSSSTKNTTFHDATSRKDLRRRWRCEMCITRSAPLSSDADLDKKKEQTCQGCAHMLWHVPNRIFSLLNMKKDERDGALKRNMQTFGMYWKNIACLSSSRWKTTNMKRCFFPHQVSTRFHMSKCFLILPILRRTPHPACVLMRSFGGRCWAKWQLILIRSSTWCLLETPASQASAPTKTSQLCQPQIKEDGLNSILPPSFLEIFDNEGMYLEIRLHHCSM